MTPSKAPRDDVDAVAPTKKQKSVSDDNSNIQGTDDHRKEKKRLQKLSHTLSWVLRHAAHELKLPMTNDGYVPVDVLLQHSHPRFKGQGWTMEDVLNVVESNDKQRFHLAHRPAAKFEKTNATMTTNDESDILCIRANQGHTIASIDSDLLLTRLSANDLLALPMIVHGTYKEPWFESICKNGLSRMKRNHIHFAAGFPKSNNSDAGKNGVISGMRKSCEVFIYLDQYKCSRDESVTFFESANGVILSAGVEEQGMLPTSYFSHVMDSDGKILLDNRASAKAI